MILLYLVALVADLTRLILEDIHEAWENNVDISERVEPVEDGRQDHRRTEAVGLLLPPFLRAFTALARTKYNDRTRDGEGRDSVNRLLLRDVLENITNSTVSARRSEFCVRTLRCFRAFFLLDAGHPRVQEPTQKHTTVR